MSRTERLSRHATSLAIQAISLSSICAALIACAPMINDSFILSVKIFACVVLFIILALAIFAGRESLRFRRMVRESRYWDQVRAIRPRL